MREPPISVFYAQRMRTILVYLGANLWCIRIGHQYLGSPMYAISMGCSSVGTALLFVVFYCRRKSPLVITENWQIGLLDQSCLIPLTPRQRRGFWHYPQSGT